MDEQQMHQRVDELATRIGYPAPGIGRTGDVNEPAVQLQVDDGTPTMMLRSDAGELSPGVFDFLVAQDLVQARQGVPQQLRWLKRGRGLVAVAAGVGVGWYLDAPVWTKFAVLLPALFVLDNVMWAVWHRWRIRRADTELRVVLGESAVRAALHWLADSQPSRKDLRWLITGAIPQPSDRLRRLPADAAR